MLGKVYEEYCGGKVQEREEKRSNRGRRRGARGGGGERKSRRRMMFVEERSERRGVWSRGVREENCQGENFHITIY